MGEYGFPRRMEMFVAYFSITKRTNNRFIDVILAACDVEGNFLVVKVLSSVRD